MITHLSPKKSKKKKLTKAQVEAQASFEKLKKEWDKLPKFASKPVAATPTKVAEPLPDKPRAKFLPGVVAARKDSTQYTGSEMLGVSQLHKSIAQPVFTKETIVENGKMRR